MSGRSATKTRRSSRTVSRRHDPAEVQADRAADTVARGGTVAGWGLAQASLTAGVHRQDKGPSDEDKLKEAGKKTGEALLETDAGNKLKERVVEDPLVKSATKFLDSTPGKIIAGGVAAAGVTTLAATKQPLPIQPPAIPLDRITPGLSAEVKVEGPLNAPTFVGVSLTLSEQGGPTKKAPSSSDAIAKEKADLRKTQDMFIPKAEKDRQDAALRAAGVAWMLANGPKLDQTTTFIPVLPGTKPKTIDTPATKAEPEKKKDDASAPPVQREPTAAGAHAASFDTTGIDAAIGDTGHPLDPAVRRSMEARFGQDFSRVRLHAGTAATHAAAGVEATAFTVGDDIAFAGGIPDAATYEGRHLLAHELAHVVQQRASRPARGGASVVHRRSVFEWIGIFFGLVEGNWTDQELRDYLAKITSSGKIDGAFDADNKARALVRKWKAATPGWDLTGRQKSLLIDEMLDGPTGDDDEDAILDLLEYSDSGDLRTIFHKPKKRWTDLDSDVNGSQNDRLHRFAAGRFRGGIAALERGKADVIGTVLPSGAPSFAFDLQRLLGRFDADDEAADIIDVMKALSDADRKAALDHLLHTTWPDTVTERGNLRLEFSQATDEAKKPLAERLVALRTKLKKLKSVILHFFLGDLPASAAELLKSTKPVPAADAQKVRDVLKPQQFQAAEEDKIELDEPDAATAKPAKTDAEASKTPAPAKPKPKTAADLRAEAQKRKDEEKKKAADEQKKLGATSKYRTDLQKALSDTIEARFQQHVVDKGKHAKSSLVEPMAGFAKDLTDDVFAAFYDKSKHPAMTFGSKDRPGNLHSWFDTYGGELEDMTRDQRVAQAKEWALYYLQSDTDVRVVNDRYDAEPEFDKDDKPKNVAARTQLTVIDDLTKAGASKDGLDNPTTVVDKLNTTERAWPGMARGKQVFVDLYLSPDKTKSRRARWRMLQTLVHEYIHTLVFKPYEDFAESFGDSSVQFNTLIEGVDEVFAGMVWEHIAPQAEREDLRLAVEGKAAAKLPALRIEAPGHYDSFDEAMRLVQLVGIRNLTAAYFLGKVDRISAPLRAPAKKAKP